MRKHINHSSFCRFGLRASVWCSWRLCSNETLLNSYFPLLMQAEKLACRKIVLRDLLRGPFHTASQCESGTVYDARRLFQVLPLKPLLYSRLLVAVNAKSFLCEFCIQGLPAVCTLRTGSPPAAHFCPFHLKALRIEQPWLKIQCLHLQNQLMSGLRVNINYPGVSNTGSWIPSLLISSTREAAHY